MFHNIDPTIASAFIAVVLMVALALAGSFIANDIQRSLEKDREEDRVKLARATGMIDTNKH